MRFIRLIFLLSLVQFFPMKIYADRLPSVKEILEKIDEKKKSKSIYMKMKQVIMTEKGNKRSMVVKIWAVNNGEKQLTEYIAPARVKGVRILMVKGGKEMWIYSPLTRQIDKLPSHTKKKQFMGLDFTYVDTSEDNYSKKYIGKTLRVEKEAGVDCYVLNLSSINKESGYVKLFLWLLRPLEKDFASANAILWVGKKDFLVRRADFYRNFGSNKLIIIDDIRDMYDGLKKSFGFSYNDDEPFQRVIFEDIMDIDGRKIQLKMLKKDLENGSMISNEILEIEFDDKINPSKFDPRLIDKN